MRFHGRVGFNLIAFTIACAGWAFVPSEMVRGDDSPQALKFFETDVRPLLANRCYKCHGPEKQNGGLRLDSKNSMLAGGESGPAIVPGDPEASLLVEAIRYESYEMPPTGQLKPREIAVLTKWIELGAPWPAGEDTPRPITSKAKITEEDRAHWAYQPMRDPLAPTDGDLSWTRNDIDRFIFRKLTEAKMTPAPEADRQTLIRRLYFDLWGLPPSPEEVEEFLADSRDDAYERLVDRLLDDSRYGERWALYWLDLVRYAESDGFRQDAYREHAWRYRDYVIRSFNEDKPYDQFVAEQLAGDEIAPDDADALVATGFLRHYIYEFNQRDARTQWQDILNDVTDTTGDVFLAMGMGCARCHDHKFDPILRKDYFRLQSYFAPMMPRDDIPAASASDREAYESQLAKWEFQTADIRARLEELEMPFKEKAAHSAVIKFPKDIQAIMAKPVDERDPLEHQLADLVDRQILFEYSSIKYDGDVKEQRDALLEELAQFDSIKPEPLPPAQTMTDVGPTAPVVTIPGRDEPILPGAPTLFDPEPAKIDSFPDSTGRRTALANWITDPGNPLTPRVIVNRIWQHHFGTGLVETASDFGRLGQPPSHPELLDWLASRFIENGWRMKSIHRLILNSATYRQAALHPNTETQANIDPQNRLRWRWDIRRLDAESIRDSVLSVTARLETAPGGPSAATTSNRRTIYTKVIRNTRDPFLSAFDLPDHITSSSNRNVTTTSTQSLLMINGEWLLARANEFAHRIGRECESDHSRIDRAFRLAYGRQPTKTELAAALSFLSEQSRHIASGATAEPLLQPLPQRDGHAVVFDSEGRRDPLVAGDLPILANSDFTVEAIVVLHSLYSDASVRTIVSRWDNHQQHDGWSLGVTSTKSKYQPRNLIMQLVGVAGYEVVASDLRPELNRPYYIAAVVADDDQGVRHVTFYLQDLSRDESELQFARVKCENQGPIKPSVPIVVGGRHQQSRHRWDGLIDDVRLSAAALSQSEFTVRGGTSDAVQAFWQFEPDAPLADASRRGHDLHSNQIPLQDARAQALVDFCHVLLNSNEFLYVD